MKAYLKALLPSQKKDSEILDIFTKKLKLLIKQHNNEEESKSNAGDIPLSLKVFINTFQIFVHDLCYLIPSDIDKNNLHKMFIKTGNINTKVNELISKIMAPEDIQMIPIDVVKMQDEQLLSLEYIESIFKLDSFPDKITQVNVLDAIVRLNHISFDVSKTPVQNFYFDQMHYSNFFKIFIENLV